MADLRLASVPREHYNKLFANLVKHRGVEVSKVLVASNALLSASFPWDFTEEGYLFWKTINDGGNPVDSQRASSNQLQSLITEAESRGFADGVSTKFGLIRKCRKDGTVYEHELCDDGSFFYHNIRVLSAKGKWCKPNEKENPKHRRQSDEFSAIHALLEEVFRFRR
jgi:hypothetical protein